MPSKSTSKKRKPAQRDLPLKFNDNTTQRVELTIRVATDQSPRAPEVTAAVESPAKKGRKVTSGPQWVTDATPNEGLGRDVIGDAAQAVRFLATLSRQSLGEAFQLARLRPQEVINLSTATHANLYRLAHRGGRR